ncbi:Metacaspase 9 [Zostera marina]|uniref:Metacaspase 9 n=1 Tax=Zostera marina TaxID=29655 RepID=A0A0K9PU27_ZOSMR|nr:Metacaspase 9 [Zostera marina]
MSPSSSSAGKKRAVICGISYKGYNKEEIEGSVNDAIFMKYLLENKYNFSDILMLTDDEKNSMNNIPTKMNILNAMEWLVKDCQQGDSLVFYYSGHGSQKKDMDGDEIDGFDETLCPLDYFTNGMITDDVINETIVRPLPSGAMLHVIIESSHSGTVLDLPFLCKMNRKGFYHWEGHRSLNGVWKGSLGGDVILFSSSQDHQENIETKEISKKIAAGGMTYYFIKALEKGDVKTYVELLNFMQSEIIKLEKKMDRNHGSRMVRVMGKLKRFLGKNQVPQLSSNRRFDVYEKAFSF